MEKKDLYISHIEKALNDAENKISKINEDILKIDGMTGCKTRHFYNNIVNINDSRYLEIGSWKGSSVSAAMFENNATIVVIDDFSEISKDFQNCLIENIEKYKGNNNVVFYNEDCFSINLLKLPKFNIYMYDAEHSSISHYKALEYYYNNMDDIFIYIVDDWNWDGVRYGTIQAINNLNLKILYMKEIITNNDEKSNEEWIDNKYYGINWWNGMVVFLLSK